MLADSTEVKALALRLRLAPVKTTAALRPTASKAGMVIKATMVADASGHHRLMGGGKKHGAPITSTISYEVEVTPTGVQVDVGWLNPRGQGHLENILVYGTSKQPPMMDITRGVRAEAPTFARHVAEIAARAAS